MKAETLCATCSEHGILAQGFPAMLLFDVMAEHREKGNCNAKLWVETMGQYRDRLARERLVEELARKREEAFKNGKDLVE